MLSFMATESISYMFLTLNNNKALNAEDRAEY